MDKKRLPYVNVKIAFAKIEAKDNYEFGFRFGRLFKKRIQWRLKANKELYKKKALNGKDFNKLVKISEKFIPETQKHFPHLLEEVKGMSDGAEVPFKELFVLICEGDVVDLKILHCISIAFRDENKDIILANNEDWFPEYKKNGLVLIKGKIKDNKFLALTYMGNFVGSCCGMNSKGIAYTDNSFVRRKFKYRIPRSFQLRALLDIQNIKEAKKILDLRSIPNNTMIVRSKLEFVAIEELVNKTHIIKGKRWLIHTNHPLNKKDRTKINTQKDSVFRYEKAKELFLKEKKFDLNSLKKVLINHDKKYGSRICGHPDCIEDAFKISTISSIIMNPNKRWIMICSGNPCRNKYKKYYL